MKSVLLQQAMVIADGGRLDTQIILTPDGDGGHAAKLVSGRPGEPDANWKLHVSATVMASPSADVEAGSEMPADALARLSSLPTSTPILSGPDVYDRVTALGHHLGTSFQWIDGVWRDGAEIVARLAAPALPAGIDDRFRRLHLLSGADRLLYSTVLHPRSRNGLGRSVRRHTRTIRSTFRSQSANWSRMTGPAWPGRCGVARDFHPSDDRGSLTGDVSAVRPSGTPAPRTAGVPSENALPRGARARRIRARHRPQLALRVVWSRAERTEAVDCESVRREALADACRRRWRGTKIGGRCSKRAARRASSSRPRLTATPIPISRGVTRALDDGGTYAGLVHLWGLDASLDDPDGGAASCGWFRAASAAGDSVQPADRRPGGAWLVSAGAVSPHRDFPVANPQQAPLWGLGRVVNIEQPDLRAVNVDIGETGGDADLLSLCDELLQPTGEEQLAFRNGARYVPRLTAMPPPFAARERADARADQAEDLRVRRSRQSGPRADGAARAGPGRSRDQHSRHRLELPRRASRARHAQGLRGGSRLRTSADMTFGFECSGTVVRAGAGVGHVRVGDNVVAALTFDGSLASYLTDRRDVRVRDARTPELRGRRDAAACRISPRSTDCAGCAASPAAIGC